MTRYVFATLGFSSDVVTKWHRDEAGTRHVFVTLGFSSNITSKWQRHETVTRYVFATLGFWTSWWRSISSLYMIIYLYSCKSGTGIFGCPTDQFESAVYTGFYDWTVWFFYLDVLTRSKWVVLFTRDNIVLVFVQILNGHICMPNGQIPRNRMHYVLRVKRLMYWFRRVGAAEASRFIRKT